MFSILNAQNKASISGFVREIETGEPLSYANVFISGTLMGTATNSDGYFVFIDIMRLNPPLQLFLPNPVRIYLSSLDTPMTKEFK